jgi:hypothetical protein
MATLPAKLHCLHVLYGTVGTLGSDHYVGGTGHAKENRKFPDHRLAIGVQSFPGSLDALAREESAQGHQHQPEDKNHRYKDEDNNADVRIVCVATKLKRQNKQPGKTRCCHQDDSQHGNPVARQQNEDWVL